MSLEPYIGAWNELCKCRDYGADVDRFIDSNVEGVCNLLMVKEATECAAVLNHYGRCKLNDPCNTSAYLAVPKSVMLRAQQVGFALREVIAVHAKDCAQACEFAVLYDAPAAKAGIYLARDLPPEVQGLSTNDTGDELTFVFAGKLAGARARVLWDSGARYNFMSYAFAQRHNLAVGSQQTRIELANGDEVLTRGHVKVKTTLCNGSEKP